ncbi:MAG: ROK family protein [Candidatus Hydrogenedentes bacterium]|nr:ROK family protein [Candidatus Hydrogenedentota bacterium]
MDSSVLSELVIACEIGGTKLQAALGTRDGLIVHRLRGTAPAAQGARAVLAWFDGAVRQLADVAAARDARVVGLGAGFGGPIESATGRVLVSHQVSGWDDVPLKAWFEDNFSYPTAIINDSNAAGWAEYCLGAGKGTRTFCYMNIGSGIGGAIVIDGKLQDGQGFGAAEIGHTYIPDWTHTTAGIPDKVENLCSGWALERRVRANAPLPAASPLAQLCNGHREQITCAMLAQAAAQGDAYALVAIEEVALGIGTALSNVITLLHPERIAMGGGVSLMGDILLDPIRRHVDALVFRPYRNRYEIVPAALGEDVVLAGGLLLAP